MALKKSDLKYDKGRELYNSYNPFSTVQPYSKEEWHCIVHFLREDIEYYKKIESRYNEIKSAFEIIKRLC